MEDLRDILTDHQVDYEPLNKLKKYCSAIVKVEKKNELKRENLKYCTALIFLHKT